MTYLYVNSIIEGMDKTTYYLARYIAGLDSEYKKARENLDVEKMRELNDTLISVTVFRTQVFLTLIKEGKQWKT